MQSELTLDTKLNQIPGIGQVYLSRLRSLSLETIGDLLYYFPFRYEDLSNKANIAELDPEQSITITASVWQITKIRTMAGRSLIKAALNDSTGSIEAVWFNQDYLLTILKPGKTFNFSGKTRLFGHKLTLTNPKFEEVRVGGEQIHTGRIVPIYSSSGGLRNGWLRSKIHSLLLNQNLVIRENLPGETAEDFDLIEKREALYQIHFPENEDELFRAQTRLGFEELFFLQLRQRLQKLKKEKVNKARWSSKNFDLEDFERTLPFDLTFSQKKAISEIKSDLESGTIMNRLLQGEVGSGKTAVAAATALFAHVNGYQTAFLAPTEILAKQHFNTFVQLLPKKIKVELLTGSSKPKNNTFDILVGTHALFQKNTHFEKLGLLVVDEQQRFGVDQRQLLRQKGKTVHLLSMTATPIPRTLALTIYGQLQFSHLEQLPLVKRQIKTYLVPKAKREKAYQFLHEKLTSGGQLFVVCPLISDAESVESIKGAKDEFQRLGAKVFPDFTVGLLHGELKSNEKDQVLSDFKNQKTKILVTTPVVEVGIDIPNASLILIEGAERFGLASLHQLRGRVGRAGQESYCLLFSNNMTEKVEKRLRFMEKTSDGLALAEYDLANRGPGDLFGTMQHGSIELKTANLINLSLIEKSSQALEELSTRKNISELSHLLKNSSFERNEILSND